MPKTRINFSITEEAHNLLRFIAEQQGVSMNAQFELLVRAEHDRRMSASPAYRERWAAIQRQEDAK